VPDPDRPATVSQPVALLAALIAAVVLWFYSEVMAADVALRLVLPVLWLALWTLACFAVGVWSLRAFVGGSHRPALVEVLAAGSALLALAATLAGFVGLYHPGMLRIVLAVATLEGCRLLVQDRIRPRLPAISLASAPGVLLVAAGALTLTVLTTPPVMFDALNYHLAFPARWLAAGGFLEFPRHFFSYYPSAHGTLYGIALSVVGPWGAGAIHWWFGMVAVLAAGALGERFGGRRGATWAAACFALTPVVLEVSGYAIADLAVAAWTGAALVVLVGDEASEGRPGRVAALAGLLIGTAAAAKYLALATVLVPVAMAAVVLAARLPIRRAVGFLAVLAVAVVITLSPWLGRNAAWTGNPIYPYLQEVLGGPPCERDVSRELIASGEAPDSAQASIGRAIAAPVIRTFNPLRSGGLLGPHWLILLPVALALPRLRTRPAFALWMAAAGGALAWGATVHYARFLLPALLPAAALAGAAAAALTSTGTSRLVSRLFTVLLVGVLGWNATVLATGFQLDRLSVIAGQLSDDAFRDRWVSYGPAIEAVNSQLPPDAVLLMTAEPRSMYLERQVMVEDPYRTPRLIELARGCSDPAELAHRVRALGATHLLVNLSEMDFYAGLRLKDDYWADASPAERLIIEGFLSENVRPLLRTDTLLVGEVITEP